MFLLREDMPTLLTQIAPQRSTQYAALADALAPYELRLSAIGGLIADIQPARFGGQDYLRLELTSMPDGQQLRELGALAMVSAFFELRERLGEMDGPWLKPLDTGFTPAFSTDMVMARRYRGKTNELFTRFMLNVARHSSAFAAEPWSMLRVLDPLAGGGTTLFSALVLGAHVAGVEKSAQDVHTTAAFIQQYAREERIPCRIKEERLKKVGRRWWFEFGKDDPRRCLLALGDTLHSAELLAGFKKPHLVVGDLPYGIQHRGEWERLLQQALPIWAALLLPGGAMALAWDATRLAREEMVRLAQSVLPASCSVLNTPPYDALAHRVDRVIKRRDVLVVVSSTASTSSPSVLIS
ncbi:MAG: hypothetical protein RMN25_05485 [Anaerolineae bacterium]|nr:hypothetical protein [Thermoflexales bacterium]MDW8407219.1 hypothetical protein [Anaerolineae bacterium]